MKRFEEDVPLKHFQNTLAGHDGQARETDHARSGIGVGMDQGLECRNGHEPMGNARQATEPQGWEQGGRQQAQAQAPHPAANDIEKPAGEPPFFQATIEEKKRPGIQQQMVPAQVHKRVGDNGPPVAGSDALRRID